MKYVNAIVLPTILIGVILYFSYHALAGEQGLAHWTRLQAQEDDLRQELAKVQANRDALKVSIARLKDDTLDLDYVYDRLLVDLPVKGQMTKQVITAGKLAIIESLDRTSGKWLWAHQTVPQNVVTAIDPVTGEKTINPDAIPQVGKTTVNCPADPGGRAWQATSYSPKTKMMYLPTVEFCSNTVVNPLDPGQVYTGGGLATYNRVPRPDSDGNIGQVRAVSLEDQKDVWMYRQHAPVTTSTLPTAGGIVFEGTLDRKLLALDDSTGKVL